MPEPRPLSQPQSYPFSTTTPYPVFPPSLYNGGCDGGLFVPPLSGGSGLSATTPLAAPETTHTVLAFPASAPVGPRQVSFPELVDHANVLAREFGFDRTAAALAEPEWYQERVGKEICDLQNARALQRLVCARCREEDPITQERARQRLRLVLRKQRRRQRVMEALILAGIVLIVCLLHD